MKRPRAASTWLDHRFLSPGIFEKIRPLVFHKSPPSGGNGPLLTVGLLLSVTLPTDWILISAFILLLQTDLHTTRCFRISALFRLLAEGLITSKSQKRSP